MDKRGTLDQEDIDMHESGCMILPTQPYMRPGNFQVVLQWAVNSRQDMIKMSHRRHIETLLIGNYTCLKKCDYIFDDKLN